MYWADELVKKIKNKKIRHRVDDMKTVSGMPHVGSLRAVCTHDIVYKAMKDAGFDAEFTYVFNDMDPMDGLPVYLDKKKYQKHMGKPLYKIPSPEKGFESFGAYYATKYKHAFNRIGCNPKIIWSHEIYASGDMDEIVRIALDNRDMIRKIYKEISNQDKPADWYPYQVICEDCGKVGSTIVTGWNGKVVTYECKKDLVTWAVGCGKKGQIEPVGENGKLMWKVDWPAHWKVLNITVEGAGKDHFSAGGSRDVGVHICEDVFNYKAPFGFLHEFFQVRGRKMSSSMGTGVSADKITEIIPPYLVRFLIVRTPLRKVVNFSPEGLTIPDLFDDYDKCASAYWDKGDQKLSRIYQLSQVEGKPNNKHFLPRFRDVANFLQNPGVDIVKKFEENISRKLSKIELEALRERKKYAQIWINNYAPEESKLIMSDSLPKEVAKLTSEQKNYLKGVIDRVKKEKDPDKLQFQLYELSKKMKINPKKAFSAIYLSFIGKEYGPKAAWFLLSYPEEEIVTRLKEVINVNST